MIAFSRRNVPSEHFRIMGSVGELSLVSSSIYECLTHPTDSRGRSSTPPDFGQVDPDHLMRRIWEVIGPVDPEMGFVPVGGQPLAQEVSMVASLPELNAMRTAVRTAIDWEGDDFQIFTGFAVSSANALIDELTKVLEPT